MKSIKLNNSEMENLTNTKRKNKKVLIGFVIIIVACVVSYFVGSTIYNNYQENKINNKREKSEIIDKKIKKLGYKTVVVNSVGYSLEKETSSETHELMFQLGKGYDPRDDSLNVESYSVNYLIRYSNDHDVVYGVGSGEKEIYQLDNGKIWCNQVIPAEEDDKKDSKCSKAQIKEIDKAKKAYNQLKKDLNVTDEELAIWAAWNMNKEYDANY